MLGQRTTISSAAAAGISRFVVRRRCRNSRTPGAVAVSAGNCRMGLSECGAAAGEDFSQLEGSVELSPVEALVLDGMCLLLISMHLSWTGSNAE